MRRYGLRDDQFARIENLLPGRPGHVGRDSEGGNRLFVEAVIWKFRSGAPWRDLPERFGDWGNDTLRVLAQEIAKRVRATVSVDWTQRESVRALMRVEVKRLLRQFGYPPDLEPQAIELVLEQARRVAVGA